MTLDADGRIWATAGTKERAGIYVFTPAGKQLAFMPVPETVTNCAFGGKDRKMLYITAGKSLYRIPLSIEGFAVFWPQEK